MTIKQTGGIFGRNVTLNDVEAETVEATTKVTTPIITNGVTSGTLTIGAGAAQNTGANILMYGEGHAQVSDFLFRAGTTQLVRMQDSGEVKIINGNVRFDTAGTGIDFSATSGAGTSELFDDYEEGTWSPVLSTGMVSGPSGYTTQRGSYTKVGNLVSAQLEMDANGAVGSAALITLSGLPFTSSANSLAHGGGFFTYSNSFSTGSNVNIHIPASDTKIAFYRSNGNQVLGIDSDVNINNLVMITVVYVAA